MVIILRTSGCKWAKISGCTMCGYKESSLSNITCDNLNDQLNQAISKYEKEPFVKVYTSGSFLDEREVPLEIRNRFFDTFTNCKRILFESRPEFIKPDAINSLPSNVTVALGLESSNPKVLKTSVNKGFTPEDVCTAGTALKNVGINVRTYILLKPLYMTELMAIRDSVISAHFADQFSDEISINPLNVQKGTCVEKLWKKGEFRPPWIWSLIRVLKELNGTINSRLMSSPSGGGTIRGVHNCGLCDKGALIAIERFNSTQHSCDLDIPSCECLSEWRSYLRSECLLGSPKNIERDFKNDLVIQGKKLWNTI